MGIEVLEKLRALCPDVVPDAIEVRGGLYSEFHEMIDTGDWSNAANAYLVEGCAGGGKTFALSFFIDRICREYPGVNILVMRNKRVDLVASWQKTYEEEVLDANDPYDAQILAGRAREGRREYTYPVDPETGLQSTITLGGMNIWERYRSTQFDIIWIVEGSEVGRTNLMGVYRALRKQRKRGFQRRAGQRRKGPKRIPKRFLLIDTNPDAEEHHLNVWANEGKLRRVRVTMQDNPLFWDRQKNEPSEDGREYLALLHAGTDGFVYERLVLGLWSTAIGAMFQMWDPRIHTFQHRLHFEDGEAPILEFDPPHPLLGESVQLVDIVAGCDWGTRNAGALVVYGVDVQGRLYLLHEVYHSERDIDWWAGECLAAWLRFRMTKILCDTDKPDNIVQLNKAMHRAFKRHLGDYRKPLSRHERSARRMPGGGAAAGIARPCTKNTTKSTHRTNWELIRWALGKDETGRPHLFASSYSRSHEPDKLLAAKSRPTDFKSEVPRARWAPYEEGKDRGLPKEEIDPKCDDHALTATAYVIAEVYGRDLLVAEAKEKLKTKARPGTWDALLDEDDEVGEEPGAWDNDNGDESLWDSQ